MPNAPGFVAYILELMRPSGHASSRAMFGGHGVYLDGMIVGIVVGDVLYLKTDAETRAAFAAQALEPFCYTTKEGEVHTTAYHRPPDEALESAAAMHDWLELALGAALRAASRKSARPSRVRAKKT